MIAKLKSLVLAVGAAAMAMVMIPSSLAAKPNTPHGKPRAASKPNVNHPHGGGGGGGGGAKRNVNAASARSGGNNYNNNAKRGNNNAKRGNNVVAGNTVVVAPNRGGGGNNGYYNNGRHYDNDWDNDDNDFLEFVGKTAAITAGVSVVAAVIGSSTNDKPDNCQQSVSNGQVYMNCNGTWYQPMQSGSQTQYTVIAPPY